MLLSIVSPLLAAKSGQSAELVSSLWIDDSQTLSEQNAAYVLITLASLSERVSETMRQRLIDDLIKKIRSFRQPSSLIKHLVVVTHLVSHILTHMCICVSYYVRRL